MSGAIVDLFGRLLVDDGGFKGAVVKTADDAGRAASDTLGKHLSSGFKTTAIKTFAGVAASAFAIATKGALDLEDVQVDLQRTTGLTADAARDAAKAINGIAGRNVTDISKVSATFEKVHNDLGLVGDAAIATTEEFVKFGRATDQGPAEAVSAFDDILDAWNLTADKSGAIMDKLIVSHQRYGGSIEDDQRALAQFAPQLKALNGTIDDGIALLDLFKASGLDAGKALSALNTAVTHLKPGQTLNDLVAEITAIEDPTQRAQKAIEIFGAKGGVALANALRPGIHSLDDFGISAEDAAGATDKAVDVIDTSVRGRLEKALSEAGAALRGFGQDFGAGLTGVASLGTLFAGLGGDKLASAVFDKVAKPVAQALREAGQKGADALGDGIQTVLSGAEGTVVGNFIASRIEAIADPTKNTVIGNAWRGAGSKAATLYLEGLYAADRVEGALIGALGAKWGGIAGKAFAAAAALASAAFVAELADLALPKVEDLGVQIHKALGLPDLDLNPRDWPWPLGDKGAPDWARIGQGAKEGGTLIETDLTQGFRDAAGAEHVDQDIADQFAAATKAAADAAAASDVKARYAAAAAADVDAYNRSLSGPEVRARMMAAAAEAGLAASQGLAVTAQEFRKAGIADDQAYADGLHDERDAIDQGMEDLKNLIANQLSKTKEIAHDFGLLASKDLAKGLTSGDPAVRRAAQAEKERILERLDELATQPGKIGKNGMLALAKAIKSSDPDVRAAALSIGQANTDALKAGMRSKDPQVRAAARALYRIIEGQLDNKPGGHTAGANTAQGTADGINSKSGPNGPIARAARHVRTLIEANLPSVITTTVNVNVRYHYPGSKSGFAAEGGVFAAGGSAYVGEKGQVERVDSLPGGGFRVTPLHIPATPDLRPRTLGALGAAATRLGGLAIYGGIHLHGIGSDVSVGAARRFAQQFVEDASARMYRTQGARRGLGPAVVP